MIRRRFSSVLVVTVACLVLTGFVPTEVLSREHRPVWLFNEQGDRITPNQNAVDPYSPKKT